MADPKQFHLRITAGPSYDPSTHTLVHVNTPQAIHISTPHLSASIWVRIQNYRGLPESSPATSSYFSHSSHKHDLYSISFSFTPHEDINGADLVFGNDFEKPIRDSLPPGFGTALRVVRWAIDPGLDGDVYADKPFLYGPLLSSINVLRVGRKQGEDGEEGAAQQAPEEEEDYDGVISEGADGEEAEELRDEAGVPADGPKRMKHFLNAEHRKDWTFEKGREYRCDFFNPYLDFNDLALRLPGVSLYLMRFWDGQPLRYTLKKKNGDVDEELFVIVFTLVPEHDLEEEKKLWKDDAAKTTSGGKDAKSDTPKESSAPKSGQYEEDELD